MNILGFELIEKDDPQFTRRKYQTTKSKSNLRRQISALVAALYPGCAAEFVGQQSRAQLKSRTFGFRVKDERGKYKSNLVWVGPQYTGSVSQSWVQREINASNR